jgi:YbgC/YbaW family acyl-CoA thioester hydrolase
MSRLKIEMPKQFPFVTVIPVRITDLNYGGHVGNDNILSIIHEARVQFLRHFGFDEMNLAGVGLIMSDVSIEFKSELFYGDQIRASVAAAEWSRIGFALYYRLEKKAGEKDLLVVVARTAMVCYDYSKKKIAAVPAEVLKTMNA